MVGSLFGGTGVSTVTALVWQAWSARGVPGVLLDAAGQWRPGLPDRLDPAALVGAPMWRDFRGRDAEYLRKDFDAVRVAAGLRSVLVSDGPRSLPTLIEEAAAVDAAARASWPLVLSDVGGSADGVWNHLAAAPADLLILVCRYSATELRDTADFLRTAGPVVDGRQSAVIAVAGPESGWSQRVSAAVAAVADAVTGVVRIDHDRGLRARTSRVGPRNLNSAVTQLAAAIAAAPTQPARRNT